MERLQYTLLLMVFARIVLTWIPMGRKGYGAGFKAKWYHGAYAKHLSTV